MNEYWRAKFGDQKKSEWSDDLIANPRGRFKFVGLEIDASLDLNITSRSTYSFLDWLGDVGGLMDALFFFCQIILLPYTTYRQKSFLMARIFHFKEKDDEKKLNEDEDAFKS